MFILLHFLFSAKLYLDHKPLCLVNNLPLSENPIDSG